MELNYLPIFQSARAIDSACTIASVKGRLFGVTNRKQAYPSVSSTVLRFRPQRCWLFCVLNMNSTHASHTHAQHAIQTLTPLSELRLVLRGMAESLQGGDVVSMAMVAEAQELVEELEVGVVVRTR
jgi:hypothetical protein